MKTFSVTWREPSKFSGYSFSYSKGQTVDVPQTDHYKIAVGAGLAICNDPKLSKECNALFEKKRKEALISFTKAYEASITDTNVHIDENALLRLRTLWGYPEAHLSDLKRQILLKVNEDRK